MDNQNKKDLRDYAQDASETVVKAGQAIDKATTNASATLGSFFERHSELQGWFMLATGVLLVLYMLNIVTFMRYIFIALTAYLLIYGMYKSRFIDHIYNGYKRLTTKQTK